MLKVWYNVIGIIGYFLILFICEVKEYAREHDKKRNTWRNARKLQEGANLKDIEIENSLKEIEEDIKKLKK